MNLHHGGLGGGGGGVGWGGLGWGAEEGNYETSFCYWQSMEVRPVYIAPLSKLSQFLLLPGYVTECCWGFGMGVG